MRKTVFAFITRTVVRVFYRRWEVVGVENVPESGPCLVVSNHNNAVVDPLVVAAVLPRPIRYIAKAALWKKPVVSTLLSLTEAIPVARPQDRKELERARVDPVETNRRAFENVSRALDRGACVGIFPEGQSHSGPDLTRLRSGAAYLALLYADAHGFGKTLPILPVGLTWTNAQKFRSDVAVVVGEPIDSGPWHDLFRERGLRAAVPLTRRIRRGLHAVTLLGESAVRRRQVERACALLEDLHRRDPRRYPMPTVRGEPLRGIRLRTSALDYVEELGQNRPRRLRALGRAIRRLEALERAAGIDPRRPRHSPVRWAGEGLLTLATLPLVVLGALLWSPIYLLARLAAVFPIRVPPDARASNKIFTVIGGAPIWWLLLLVGLPLLVPVWWAGLAVAAAAPLLGWWALTRIERTGELLDAGWTVFRRASVEGELLRRRARVGMLLREELNAAAE